MTHSLGGVGSSRQGSRGQGWGGVRQAPPTLSFPICSIKAPGPWEGATHIQSGFFSPKLKPPPEMSSQTQSYRTSAIPSVIPNPAKSTVRMNHLHIPELKTKVLNSWWYLNPI